MGLAIARRLLADEYAVLAIDINARALGGEAFSALRAEHEGRLEGYEGSVTDRDAMRAAAAHCKERWGRLDVLVNNAGLNRPGGMFDLDEADWDAVVAVNLKGAWLCALAAVPLLMPVPAAGQKPAPPRTAWGGQPHLTPWGHPDLQGLWTTRRSRRSNVRRRSPAGSS